MARTYADYLDALNRGPRGNPLMAWYRGIENLYNASHGGARYILSQLPFSGRLRQFADTTRQWENQYESTGNDPNYSTAYGRAGLPFVNDFLGNIAKPVKMANSLMKMYGAEVELNLQREKKETARAYATNAVLWHEAWEERNKGRY